MLSPLAQKTVQKTAMLSQPNRRAESRVGNRNSGRARLVRISLAATLAVAAAPGGGVSLPAALVSLAPPPAAKTIRFGLEITPRGAGNKNVELVITDGTFHAAAD